MPDLTRAFWLEAFAEYLNVEAGNSNNTVQAYLRDVRRFARYAADRRVEGPAAVTAPQLRDFVYQLKDMGLATSSIRRQISALRTYYRFLVAEGHVARDPSGGIELPKMWQRLPEVLSVAEVEALLGAPTPDEPLGWRDRALLEVAYGTGIRVSELVGLNTDDIWFDEALIRVLGKGSKERLVPIGRRALGAAALYGREIRPGYRHPALLHAGDQLLLLGLDGLAHVGPRQLAGLREDAPLLGRELGTLRRQVAADAQRLLAGHGRDSSTNVWARWPPMRFSSKIPGDSGS